MISPEKPEQYHMDRIILNISLFSCSENCIHALLLIAKPIIYLCGCTSCVCSEILRHNIKSLHEQTEPVIAIPPCE